MQQTSVPTTSINGESLIYLTVGRFLYSDDKIYRSISYDQVFRISIFTARASAGCFQGWANLGIWGFRPRLGSWTEPRWELGQIPQKPTNVLKIMHSSTERFAVITNAPKHFTTFPGGAHLPPLPMPAGTHDLYYQMLFVCVDTFSNNMSRKINISGTKVVWKGVCFGKCW